MHRDIPSGVLRLAAPILYARPLRAAFGRGTTKCVTTMHGQRRRYRLLSRHIPSSLCQEIYRRLFHGGSVYSSVWTLPTPVRRASSVLSGGARRDRTDDLMLAKHALSQLSYGPVTRRRNASNKASPQRQTPIKPRFGDGHRRPAPGASGARHVKCRAQLVWRAS